MAKHKCTSEENKHSSVEIEHSDNIQNKETPTFCTPQHSLYDVTNNVITKKRNDPKLAETT